MSLFKQAKVVGDRAKPWYCAPGWWAAARKIKNNTRIPKETGYMTPGRGASFCGLVGIIAVQRK
jgi:hypothetical protein